MPIKHTSANENLILIFINYLGFLDYGDEYRTITFCSFWTNIISTENLLGQFIDANESALKKGVKLERLLVIQGKRQNDSENAEYIDHIKKTVIRNVELMAKYPGYKFKLLFSDDHDSYQKKEYNFAIITSSQTKERIIFKPQRNSHHIQSTDISKDKNKIFADETRYKEIMNLWESQIVSLENKSFIVSLNLKDKIVSRLFKNGL